MQSTVPNPFTKPRPQYFEHVKTRTDLLREKTAGEPPPDPNWSASKIHSRLVELIHKYNAGSTTQQFEEWGGILADVAGLPTDPSDRRAAAVVNDLADNFHRGHPDVCRRVCEAIRTAMLSRLPAEDNAARDGWNVLVNGVCRRLIRQYFDHKYCRSESKPEPELIAGLLMDNMPLVIGGRSKSMKSTLAAAMTASLQFGKPFLGRPARRAKVYYLTLERTPEDVGRMVDKFAGAWIEESDDADMNFPTVTNLPGLVRFTEGVTSDLDEIVDNSDLPVVVVLDPLYLLLGGGSGNDLAAAGERLRNLVNPVIRSGATPVLVHHTVKSSAVGEWPSLDDLNGAGVAEFARSWLILSRSREYDGGGVHDLLAVTGTSRGAHERVRVRVDEREWTVTASPEQDNPTPPPAKPRGRK